MRAVRTAVRRPIVDIVFHLALPIQDMRITFLGTGSAMPTRDRHQTGILLEDRAADGPLLVDCGAGVLHNLAQTSVGYEGVDTVLLTHHHLDHTADLLPLLKARWLAGEEHLNVVGPEGTEALLDSWLEAFDYLRGRMDLEVREVAAGEFGVAGFDVRAMETRHSVDCLAYRFDNRFVFSGDSEAFEELAEFAQGAAVFAHDCSFPDGVDVENHPTPSALGKELSGTEIGRVYLTHLYPHTEGKEEEMVAAIGEHYEGEVRLASDMLSLSVE
ncbi:MAG: ribonuclease BN (tRNA processing enzyme) [Natrialbaceae archaeon]|jgi:ribonuclease BN (tRNA processing enzyme)